MKPTVVKSLVIFSGFLAVFGAGIVAGASHFGAPASVLHVIAVQWEADAPAAQKQAAIQGTLVQRPGSPPALETSDHRVIALDGDDPTKGVLNDKRLAGFHLEAKGHFTAPDQFLVDPIHTQALFVHKEGHVKVITYWC